MYPITNEIKALFESEQRKVLRITGTDKNGATITITDNDVIIDSFEIDRYSCNGQILEIGTAISAQLSMKLENTDGRYDNIVFEGAELFVEVGIADWSQANPTITWVPCGYFTPDIQPRRMTTISITALDRMMWFENVKVLLHPWTTQSGEVVRSSSGEPIYFVSNASLTFPCTVAQLVQRVCALCSVPFSQNLSSLPNYNYTISELLVTDQNISFRNIIQWCAGIMGANAWIDWSGSLRFSWYNNDTGYVSTVDNRLSSDLYENAIVITGVKCTLPDDESTMYIAGSNDYAIDLTGNNLINADNVQTILQNIYYVLNAFAYTPFSANVIAAPYLWPMDRVVFTDKDGNGHVSALTNVNLSLNGNTAISAVGESLKAYSYGDTGSFSAKQKAELQKWHSNVVADTKEAIDNASAQITGADGGYVRFMYDENGIMTEILIMNTPDIATATKVWRWNQGGFGYSSNGYQGPFTTAITQDGSIVANFITTGILNADLIQAGTMLADRIFGGTLTLGGNNNVNGILEIVNANGDVIGTWNKDGISVNNGVISGSTINGSNINVGGTYGDTHIGVRNNNNEYVFYSYNSETQITYYRDSGTGGLNFYSRGDGILATVGGIKETTLDKYVWYTPTLYSNSRQLTLYLSNNGSSEDINSNITHRAKLNPYGISLEKVVSSNPTILINLDCDGLRLRSNYIFELSLVSGSMSWSGTKSRLVSTDQYTDRLLYCYETPSPLFGDVGEAIIGDDGLCYVTIDPIFAQTITTDNYQVFLQKYGDGDCYVMERKPGWFVVAGTPGLAFGWEIKGKQQDYDQLRLDRNDEKFTVPMQTYGDDAARHINDIQKERIPA